MVCDAATRKAMIAVREKFLAGPKNPPPHNYISAGSWGCVATVDREGRTIFVADAHRGDGRRFVVHAEEKVTAMLELERAICLHILSEVCEI
jgi:hypothetical protein